MKNLAREVRGVVKNGNCSGCGACSLLSDDIAMELSGDGFLRPHIGDEEARKPRDRAVIREFRSTCPGILVDGRTSDAEARVHEVFGPYRSSWVGFAIDSDIRYTGSSGGVLTALNAWLLQSGGAAQVVASRGNADAPRRTEAVLISSPEDLLATAGSRYAPVAAAATYRQDLHGSAFVGKPCEVSAVAQLQRGRAADTPLLLSFFCAGTPSQRATDVLIEQLRVTEPVVGLWYRGRGWPGNFTVRTADGEAGSVSYDESWGSVLGGDVQSRCKICPDGTGYLADVVVGDYWRTDAHGYPSFVEGDGQSAVISRTERGHKLLMGAVEAGVVNLTPLDLDSLLPVQPPQVERLRALIARLAGRVLAGRRVPKYKGFNLSRLSHKSPRSVGRALTGSLLRALKEESRGKDR